MELAIIDLNKYGLSHLKDTYVSSWRESDVDRLIGGFVAESIAPAISGLRFRPDVVYPLLAKSHCRRCGACCDVDSGIPNHPGVIVLEEDLRRFKNLPGYSFKRIRRSIKRSTNPDFAKGMYLALPCMFYRGHQGCGIYNARPLVCRTYPIADTPDGDITVNLRCEYGKDIYRIILKMAKTEMMRRALNGEDVVPAPMMMGTRSTPLRERSED